MPTDERRDDWCRRLGDALLDGRFIEDPGFWSAHRSVCPECEARVRGLLHLRTLIEASRSDVTERATAPTGTPPDVLLARVTERLRRHRSRRRIQWMVGIGLVIGVGATQFLRVTGRSDAPMRADEPSIARRLLDRIAKPDGTMDLARVGSDARLEAECRAALRSPVPNDRQVAFMILALGQRPLDAAVTSTLLSDARPHLDRPIEVASGREPTESVAAALAQGRTATLVSVLGALPSVLVTEGQAVAPEVIEPYVHDGSAEVRELAIVALGFHPRYRPSEAMWQVLRGDRSLAVRAAAAVLLVRAGEPERVAEHFSAVRDFAAEGFVATAMGLGPRALVLAHRRIAGLETPIRLGLSHALRLLRARLPFDRSVLIARALADTTRENDDLLTDCAAAGDWIELRLALRERWRSSPEGYARERVAAGLASWDARSGDPYRFSLALEVLERDMSRAAVDAVAAIRASSDPATSRRAAAILESWERRQPPQSPSSNSKE